MSEIEDSASAPTAAPVGVHCFGADGWYTLAPDPVDAVIKDGDFLKALQDLGYDRWTRIGDEGDGAVPLAIDVFARTDAPRFAVQVQGSAMSFIETVYADDLPSMMTLLGRWVPTAQAAALVHLAAALKLPTDPVKADITGLLGQIGAKPGERIVGKLDDLKHSVDQLGEGLEREIGRIAGTG